MNAGRLIGISTLWFATNVQWTALLAIMLPAEVREMSRAHAAESLGLLIGLGAVFALVIPLVVGPLSDRCMARLGRRRPFILTGILINVIGLLGMLVFSKQLSFWGYFAGYCVVQVGNNIATGAYQGVIPDVVIPEQRGVASGYMGLMTQFGSALGAVLAIVFRHQHEISYGLMIAVLLLAVWSTFAAVKETPLSERPPKIGVPEFLKKLWVDPRKHPNFAWVWLTRALVMFGFYSIQPYIQYYLTDVVHIPGSEVEMTTGKTILAILLFATITGLLGGWLSDRIGRKSIVYAANGVMAVAAVGLVFCHTFPQALSVGVVFGLGYGAYVSVDWALGTDVLPNKEDAGKDMAVWHIAMVLPQSLAAPVAGTLLGMYSAGTEMVDGQPVHHYSSTGYLVIFGVAAGALALGGLLLRNVRGVK